MAFGLGPVLRYELITTARRRRYYVGRTAYGSVLLFLLWRQFGSWELSHPAGGTPEELHRFAESTFIVFAQAQLTALLCVLPALLAGVIADELHRKTLHYLLASRLSSVEIVLGKLGARLLHVGVIVALGLPVVSLLALYGGLDPEKVIAIYAGTFTTVLAVSGLSIFISVLARRPRDAILAAYGLEALWLLGPPAIRDVARYLEDGPLWWVFPVNSLMLLSNPLFLLDKVAQGFRYFPGWDFPMSWAQWLSGPGTTPFEMMFEGMLGIQLLVGLSFLSLAIAGLRPLRGNTWPGAEPRTGWWTRVQGQVRSLARHRTAAAVARNELLASRLRRPACGDAPMIWKERHTTMGGGLSWLGGRPVVLFCGVLLGCYLFDVAYPVVGGDAAGPRRRLVTHGESGLAIRDGGAVGPGPAGHRRGVGRGDHRRARAGDLDQPGDDAADARRGRPRQAVRGRLECPSRRAGDPDHLGRRHAARGDPPAGRAAWRRGSPRSPPGSPRRSACSPRRWRATRPAPWPRRSSRS